MGDLKGKTVFITEVAEVLGKLGIRLAKEGANIVIAANSRRTSKITVELSILQQKKLRMQEKFAYTMDIRSEEMVEAAVSIGG
ncbi:MAG: hypothetical protein R2728_11070 [Chitinophagales bacterium]